MSDPACLAQEGNPVDCFKAQEILFPLSANDFSKSEILVQGKATNAVYYQYQDKYSFWYKFVAKGSSDIMFSVSPSKSPDRYGVTIYRYGKNDFCDKLVNQGLEPEPTIRNPVFLKSGTVDYMYSLKMAAGDTIFVSVLSLNAEDCGHFLKVESGAETLSVHAIHRQCYDFAQLEIPDFKAVRIHAADVNLYLSDLAKASSHVASIDAADDESIQSEPLPTPENEPAKDMGYDGLTTVVIEANEDDLITVGDRLVLNNVFFYSNTFAFKPESEDELLQLLQFLHGNADISVEIQGHTANNTENIKPDPNFKGQGKAWNFKGNSLQLSEERARAVRQYLISNGVDKKRLVAKGYGDTQKRISEASSFEEAQQNMRVEVVITGK